MAAASGNEPVIGPDGEVLGPKVPSVLTEPGFAPTLRENLALGIGKAHRAIQYAHHDYRNFKRNMGNTGRVG